MHQIQVSILCPQVHVLMETRPWLYPNYLLLNGNFPDDLNAAFSVFSGDTNPRSLILLRVSLNQSLVLFQITLSLLFLSLCPGLASVTLLLTSRQAPFSSYNSSTLSSPHPAWHRFTATLSFRLKRHSSPLDLLCLALPQPPRQSVTTFLAKHGH